MRSTVTASYSSKTGSGFLDTTVNSRSIAAFFLGCLTPIPIQSIGLVFIGELLLLAVGIAVLVTRIDKRSFWSPTATRFIVLLLLALFGYVSSDLIRGTPAEDYLRGWSKIAFIATDFVAFYYLLRRNTSAVPAFLIGFEISRYVVWTMYYRPILGENYIGEWKFGLGVPLTIITLCLLALAKRRVFVGGVSMIAFGALHFFMDYRSVGGMCFVLGAILLATRQTKAGLRVDKRLLFASVAVCAMFLAFAYIATQEGNAERRGGSNAWRFGTTIALMKGIARSPLIGSGSWSSDSQMEAWRDEAMESQGVSRYAAGKNEQFVGHSEILQAWYEGGVATVFFFLYYGYYLVFSLILLIKHRMERLSAIFIFWLLYISWGFFLNPLNGIVRVEIAFALAIICHLRAEQQEALAYRRRQLRYSNQATMRAPRQDFRVSK